MYRYCLSCLHPTPCPLPCPGCSHVVFCSGSCRDRALAGWHRYECQLDLYSHRQTDTKDSFRVFMCLKAVLERRVETILSRDRDALFDRLWNMATHQTDRDQHNRVKGAVIAVFLLRCIRLTSYLQTDYGEQEELVTTQGLSCQELDVGEILHHCYMVDLAF